MKALKISILTLALASPLVADEPKAKITSKESAALVESSRSELEYGLAFISKLLDKEISEVSKRLGILRSNRFLIENGAVGTGNVKLSEVLAETVKAELELKRLEVIQAELAKEIANQIISTFRAAPTESGTSNTTAKLSVPTGGAKDSSVAISVISHDPATFSDH